MTITDAVIQAVIQGLTEFLPVSSSGHLKLWQAITGQSVQEGTFLLVILHMGTLAAVFAAFRDTIFALMRAFFRLLRDIFTGKLRRADADPDRRMLLMLMLSLVLLVPFYFIRDFFANISLPALAVCFLFTSAELFFADRVRHGDKTAGEITVPDAVTVGLFQCAALFPGISRSGSTISAGLLCGLDRETAVRYSFILGIPAILGGCVSELLDLAHGAFTVNLPAAGIGFLVSAAVGTAAIRLISFLVRTEHFRIFSVYTFLAGALTAAVWLWQR